jgi:hypothetical protein
LKYKAKLKARKNIEEYQLLIEQRQKAASTTISDFGIRA